MIVIVDYGVGNVGSIFNMLQKIGAPACMSSDAERIRSATKLILPGVGHFDAAMTSLNNSGLKSAIEEAVHNKLTPILGICVGMQIMTKASEEGSQSGLGWISAHTKHFDFQNLDKKPRLPHIGWNYVSAVKQHFLSHRLQKDPRFYFVHSFHVVCEDAEDVLLKAKYGVEFSAAFASKHICGVQFHPEKSHKYGMQLLRGFAGLVEQQREALATI